MSQIFQWVTSNPLAGLITLITFSIIVISVVIIYLVAFFQGREISFWPPKIGVKFRKSDPPKTSNKAETVLSTNGISLEDRQALRT